ncbi:MAG: DNA repair protein RecN [Desulfuromonadales bacterium GWC2_61_20]|nr:MAG: DNA repair protein RecN [Desulfuromonadales bacterium GWC2_61_20]HAD03533.1 DNA repair protein RecN [Desulfuromonas sp.]HBT83759.1 DNA repair protein RecN [Desulfuromonas sp.]
MLLELVIRNFATIDKLAVTFGPGFNVLTGETGAGKSIIIDAVGLLLGERARPDLIRTGEEEATVEAVLDLTGQDALRQELAAAGFEESAELLVKRVISRAGKNRIYLNGSLATLAQLQPVTAALVTIYGQHEHQHLLRSETHLPLLDTFAGLGRELEDYRRVYAAAQAERQRLEKFAESERERRQRLDLLTFQQDEIAAAAPRLGEDDDLAAERLLLQHAERLNAATAGGYETLYGGDGAICEELGRLAGSLEELTKIDPRLGSLAETLRSALLSLEDAASQLRSLAERTQFDPDRQQEVEERLATLAALKRKYGTTLAAVLQHRLDAAAQLAELAGLAGSREDASRRLGELEAELAQIGRSISAARSKEARELQSAVEAELHQLAMPRARFEVRLTPLDSAGPRGLERGEFFLSPNPGEEPKALARIASGGELSRVMLALKRAIPDGERVPTLIFDEVDAGIGGAAATAVGEKLRQAAVGIQVLCITHLPQVAAFAERHYRVDKRQEHERTFTALTLLDPEARVQEMARMLGGAKVTERTLEHARELIGLPGLAPSRP